MKATARVSLDEYPQELRDFVRKLRTEAQKMRRARNEALGDLHDREETIRDLHQEVNRIRGIALAAGLDLDRVAVANAPAI